MKKTLIQVIIALPLLLISTCYLNAASLDDLTQAIKDLDIDQVTAIIGEKAQDFKENDLQDLKESVAKSLKKPLHLIMWYHNYKALAKVAAGALGLGVSGRFIYRAIQENPESHISIQEWLKRFFVAQPTGSIFSEPAQPISTTLCLAQGAVGALSAATLIKGIKDLRRYQKHSKIYAINNLIDRALSRS